MQPAAPIPRMRRAVTALRAAKRRALARQASASTPLEALGAGIVTYGVGMIWLPAGVIVGGLVIASLGYLLGLPPTQPEPSEGDL